MTSSPGRESCPTPGGLAPSGTTIQICDILQLVIDESLW